ncbi:MAG: P-loop NTPase [Coriobacteriales bacterium]|jgi:pilus assembly protein CpaE|nr:P-loop NTPase [Coriobacteriales bacterium]
MSEEEVAYLPIFSRDGAGDGGDEQFVDDAQKAVTVFTSSEECRRTLLNIASSVPVVVRNGGGSVTPINLAAALCVDAPERDVYLMEDNPTQSLVGRARAAGIRGILNGVQVRELLCAMYVASAPVEKAPPTEAPALAVWGVPVEVSVPVATPAPAEAPAPIEVSAPAATPAPAEVPAPIETTAPAEVPAPAENPVPAATPAPVVTPAPVTAPAPVATPAPIAAPAPAEVTRRPLPEPSASSEPAAPASPVALQDFHDTTIPSAASAQPALNRGRVIGFFSGRGGVGKSTVSLMTAFAAQKRGSRVALVDFDLQFGDLDYLAGKEPSSRIQRLTLAQLCAQEHDVSLSDDALALVCAPEHPEQGEQFAPAISRMLEMLVAQRDMVVINTGSFWTDIHARAAQHCDHLALLMDQRATSIEACKQVVDLCIRMRMPQVRFHYLLNGCGRHASLMPQDVSLALGGVEVCGLADGGTLVDELLALGCPLELLGSGNAFVASLENFLDGLVGHSSSDEDFQETAGSQRHKSKILDFAALKGFFEGARRVAT